MNAYYRRTGVAEKTRERVNRYRARNLEQVQEKDRARGRRAGDPVKERARKILFMAVARGDVVPGACEVCGTSPVLSDGRRGVHGHHDDYEKPLEVRWLCTAHHGEAHRMIHA
jgi:hypothetical protein